MNEDEQIELDDIRRTLTEEEIDILDLESELGKKLIDLYEEQT